MLRTSVAAFFGVFAHKQTLRGQTGLSTRMQLSCRSVSSGRVEHML